MIIFDEERPSDSPFIERIWRSHTASAWRNSTLIRSNVVVVEEVRALKAESGKKLFAEGLPAAFPIDQPGYAPER